MSTGNGQGVPAHLKSEDEERGRTQAPLLFINATRRGKCTGNLVAGVKWMQNPILVSPRTLRHQMDWPSHALMTSNEFQIVLKMMKARSEHAPETETMRDGGDVLMKLNDMCRVSRITKRFNIGNHDETPERSRMEDRVHLVCEGRIDHATMTVLM